MTRSRFFSYEAFGVSSPFDPTFHYVSSPILPASVLGALRLLFAAYTLVTIIVNLVNNSNSYLSYFTDLTYIGITAYFWAAGVQTVAFVFRGRKNYPLQTWPRFLQLLHVLLYSTITVFPILVTVVFWTLIASSATFDTRFDTWSAISMHVMNTFFALFEIVSHGGPSPWIHLSPLIVILACYVGIAYITRATAGFYVYSFLDPTKEGGLLAAYIVGIALGCCVLFAIVKGLCHLRHRASIWYGRFEDDSVVVAIDDWEEMAVPKESSATA